MQRGTKHIQENPLRENAKTRPKKNEGRLFSNIWNIYPPVGFVSFSFISSFFHFSCIVGLSLPINNNTISSHTINWKGSLSAKLKVFELIFIRHITTSIPTCKRFLFKHLNTFLTIKNEFISYFIQFIAHKNSIIKTWILPVSTKLILTFLSIEFTYLFIWSNNTKKKLK